MALTMYGPPLPAPVRPALFLLLAAVFSAAASADTSGDTPPGCPLGCHIDASGAVARLSGAGVAGQPGDAASRSGGGTVHVAATAAVLSGDGSSNSGTAQGSADAVRGGDGRLPSAVPVEMSGVCVHGARLVQTVLVPAGALEGAGLQSGSPQSLVPVAPCGCAVGDATPEAATAGVCESCKTLSASAPLTCGGVSTGRLSGTTNYFVNASAHTVSDTASVLLSGYCQHGNFFTGTARIVVYKSTRASLGTWWSCDISTVV